MNFVLNLKYSAFHPSTTTKREREITSLQVIPETASDKIMDFRKSGQSSRFYVRVYCHRHVCVSAINVLNQFFSLPPINLRWNFLANEIFASRNFRASPRCQINKIFSTKGRRSNWYFLTTLLKFTQIPESEMFPLLFLKPSEFYL